MEVIYLSTIEESLLNGVKKIIEQKIKQLKFNYYITGKITAINIDGTYDLTYNGEALTNIKAREGLTLIIGDIVYICVVNGNFFEKFIDCKRP